MPRSDQAPVPPLAIGALLRFALDDVRARIYDGVVAAGFGDLRRAHVTLFRWPGPDGQRPSDLADAAGISKQALNELLRELEELGYLERHAHAGDARGRLIRLTRRGKRLHQVAVGVHEQVEREWAKAVGARRYDAMRETLAEIVRLGDGG